MRPLKQFRWREVNAAASVFALLSVLLLPTPTVSVIPVFTLDLLKLEAMPPSDAAAEALPTYYVAPTEGPGIPSNAVETSARELEKEMRIKLADSTRVKEATDIYRKVTDCSDYPCEVVVEEVRLREDSLIFELELKVIRPPSDRSHQTSHPGIDDSYTCTITTDMTAEDCRSEAPKKLAYFLKLHDQNYHNKRNQ